MKMFNSAPRSVFESSVYNSTESTSKEVSRLYADGVLHNIRSQKLSTPPRGVVTENEDAINFRYFMLAENLQLHTYAIQA